MEKLRPPSSKSLDTDEHGFQKRISASCYAWTPETLRPLKKEGEDDRGKQCGHTQKCHSISSLTLKRSVEHFHAFLSFFFLPFSSHNYF